MPSVPKLQPVAASDDLLSVLRGAPADRPLIDPSFRAELQATVQDAASDVGQPMHVSKVKLSQIHQCEGRYLNDQRSEPNLAMVKGMLVHRAIQKSLDGGAAMAPQRVAESLVHRGEQSTKPIGAVLRALTPAERQQLVDDITDFHVAYTTMFPRVPSEWVRAEVDTSAQVSRSVTIGGRIDMKLGQRSTTKASTVLIDFKTGMPSTSDRDDLRFYSLIETLGTGGQPYRFANIYLKENTYEAEDVTQNTLWSAARRLSDGVTKMHELEAGRPPTLSPGPVCRFCPSKPHCPSAADASSTDGAEDIDF